MVCLVCTSWVNSNNTDLGLEHRLADCTGACVAAGSKGIVRTQSNLLLARLQVTAIRIRSMLYDRCSMDARISDDIEWAIASLAAHSAHSKQAHASH